MVGSTGTASPGSCSPGRTTCAAEGRLDLLGPSTRSAVAAVAAGRPLEEAGRYGTTNGAAMRIAPVGIAVPATDLDLLVDRVVEASWVTHNTGVALAGAAAVAAAVSAGLDGADPATATATAVRAATRAGHPRPLDRRRRHRRPDRLGHPPGHRQVAGDRRRA